MFCLQQWRKFQTKLGEDTHHPTRKTRFTPRCTCNPRQIWKMSVPSISARTERAPNSVRTTAHTLDFIVSTQLEPMPRKFSQQPDRRDQNKTFSTSSSSPSNADRTPRSTKNRTRSMKASTATSGITNTLSVLVHAAHGLERAHTEDSAKSERRCNWNLAR